MEQVKLFIKILFSPEIYDEIAQEIQDQADAKRLARDLERETPANDEDDCYQHG